MIAPLAVDLRALRTLVGPDINIVPGRAMMARVVNTDPAAGRGSLSIAGFLVEAELPKDVQPGQDLRLVVRDVSAERVLLTVTAHDQPGAAGAQPAATQTPAPPTQPSATPVPPPPVAVPLPGGGTVQVTEREARPGSGGGLDEGSHVLSLRYQAPSLGAVDLRFALDPGSLQMTVTVPAGVYALAQENADALRGALSDELGRAVAVTITPRREPVSLYA